jgi:tRNA U34 5-methylaminomethyl-2-thiouridine-forming methyltransferase MnmC
LNAFLTCITAARLNIVVEYYAIEKYPVDQALIDRLNYPQLSDPASAALFNSLHRVSWDQKVKLTDLFEICKIRADLTTYEHKTRYDLIYFDAFSPSKQPGLWTNDIFRNIYNAMNPGGILVTYCVKGDVRRALISAGFSIEKLPGPTGKRQMLRAVRDKN